jgi:class 3 adenylate cyclase/tetratricopeptide (TPR) repeat protein
VGGTGVETVTVLITDLVGSTQLEARVGPIVAEQLREEHFGLLRDAVGEAGGREVKNTGDGLMVAFESAAAAVSCAVSIQQRFDRRNRGAEEPLAIKAGVSAGDASTAEGDVFGMPVIEAARLCDRCSPGQILAKELVAHLATGRGHAFTSVGDLELKGLSEPLSAVEVQWEPALVAAIALPERLRELPATAYVGRMAERERLTELWGEAREGSLRLVPIGGEAGVGKTRLSTHLAHEAHEDGATVLYGRSDEDLGVPYQPWAQALGHLVREAPQRVLSAHVERFGGDLARLVPALRDRLPDLPSPRESDPETERYLLYAAVVGLLERASEEEPLLLILDDLHWADQPTLSLLRHFVTAGVSMRVLVVGAYRDSELSQDHPLAPLLADLHRESGVERMKLTGLHSEEVEALMEAAAGHELDEGGRELAAEITRETAGNPFFAGELLRHLTESGAIVQREGGRWHLAGDLADLGLPQSVREVIGRRVGRLGSEARTALSAAAVIGRDFDLDLLLAVVDVPQARLLDLLDEGVAASLLQENRDRAGRFTFTHALVEHALFEDLGATRRAVLHRQIAEALEGLCGDEPGERLGELAAHWAAAVVSADTAKAIHYAQQAAERALAQLAPDEAIRWYQQALELHAQARSGDRSLRCELLIGLGDAQRQVGNPAFRQTLLDASELAQELGDTDRLARAVLASTRGFSSSIGSVDSERVQALEAASQALPDSDPRRARVLALLASELHWAGEPSRCRQLAEEAIEIARAAGDPVALAHALAHVTWAIWTPDTLADRRRLVDEMFDLTQGLDDPWLSTLAAFRGCGVGIEGGDRSLTEFSLRTLHALSASVPQLHIRRIWLQFESVWIFMQGNLEASEQRAIQAFEAGTAAGESDALMLFGGVMSVVRTLQGRLGELAEQTVQLASEPGGLAAWRALAAHALIEEGRGDEARELALAEDMRNIPWDQAWSAGAFAWAIVCSRLGVVERAGELYELLTPFSGQLAATPGMVSGTFAWALGTLATTLERYEQAEGHFATAVEIEERLGAPLFLARTRVGWARVLIARGGPDDLEGAKSMLEQAEEAAERLGAEGVMREVAECRGALAAISG